MLDGSSANNKGLSARTEDKLEDDGDFTGVTGELRVGWVATGATFDCTSSVEEYCVTMSSVLETAVLEATKKKQVKVKKNNFKEKQ